MVEQRFPLSGVRGHRQRAAEADARRFRAESERVSQDVQLDAARSFFMLRERREMARVLDEQVAVARQFVAAASARYSSGTGSQPEVLRAEIEVARFEGAIRTIRAEGRSAGSWHCLLWIPVRLHLRLWGVSLRCGRWKGAQRLTDTTLAQ
jgi:outer membrane protein TolC